MLLLLDPQIVCPCCLMNDLLCKMLQPPSNPVGMNPLKPLCDSKYTSYFKLISKYSGNNIVMNACMEYIRHFFATVMNVQIVSSGDPREFFVELVRTHYPELQIYFGFGLVTESKFSTIQ